METHIIDGGTLKRLLIGGADRIHSQIEEINDLNVFPVPDGDTGTNMSRTVDSGVAEISAVGNDSVGEVAARFAKGSLLGARGNSGVILSQFFAGIGEALTDKKTVGTKEFAEAYLSGVKKAYSAVVKPVEGTILTVFRESAEFAYGKITEDSTLEEFLSLTVGEASRSLARTKEMLRPLAEADVVDSGGAGYLCIATGMYDTLVENKNPVIREHTGEPSAALNYDLFTASSELEFGYCTECLVRLQHSKTDINTFDVATLSAELEENGCNSVVILKDNDILKLHAHTMTPSVILTLAQQYGEFLNIKIENMTLQHTERETQPKKPKLHKKYAVVAVTTGEGLSELFRTLGADEIINGGQTGNPSAEDFIEAFKKLDADNIIVLPNNGNIILTAKQASELYGGANIEVIPTKTLPEGYAALAVYNAEAQELDELVSDMTEARRAVMSIEATVAVRDTTLEGMNIKRGESIAILNGKLAAADGSIVNAVISAVEKIEDIDEREILTVFVGAGVGDAERVEMLGALEERFEDLTIESYIGGQEVYSYLISVE